MEKRLLEKIMPKKTLRVLATRINVPMAARRKKVKNTKVKTSSPLQILKSIGRRTGAFDVGSKGTIIATIQRRLKEPLKRHIFYPTMKRKCQLHLNCHTHGGECGIKVLLYSWIQALPITLFQLNLHRSWE